MTASDQLSSWVCKRREDGGLAMHQQHGIHVAATVVAACLGVSGANTLTEKGSESRYFSCCIRWQQERDEEDDGDEGHE